MNKPQELAENPGRLTFGEVPEGFDALVLADIARASRSIQGGMVGHVARDDARMSALAEALAFFAPDVEIELFPAWDCLPYDRVSPNGDISARRMATLSRLAARAEKGRDKPLIVLLTVNAALQRVPARETVGTAAWSAHVGNRQG